VTASSNQSELTKHDTLKNVTYTFGRSKSKSHFTACEVITSLKSERKTLQVQALRTAIQFEKAFSTSHQKLKDKVRRALESAKTSTSCKMSDEFAYHVKWSSSAADTSTKNHR